MVMNHYGEATDPLESASTAELLDEIARRHNDAPYVFVVLDDNSGGHMYETVGTSMPLPDILKSLACAIEQFDGEAGWNMSEIKPG